jgi:hypothetical protein
VFFGFTTNGAVLSLAWLLHGAHLSEGIINRSSIPGTCESICVSFLCIKLYPSLLYKGRYMISSIHDNVLFWKKSTFGWFYKLVDSTFTALRTHQTQECSHDPFCLYQCQFSRKSFEIVMWFWFCTKFIEVHIYSRSLRSLFLLGRIKTQSCTKTIQVISFILIFFGLQSKSKSKRKAYKPSKMTTTDEDNQLLVSSRWNRCGRGS